MTGTNTIVSPSQFIPPGLESALFSPAGLGVLACGAVIVIAKIIDSRGGKAKLATARWGGTTEKTAARQLACKQIQQRLHTEYHCMWELPRIQRARLLMVSVELASLKIQQPFIFQRHSEAS